MDTRIAAVVAADKLGRSAAESLDRALRSAGSRMPCEPPARFRVALDGAAKAFEAAPPFPTPHPALGKALRIEGEN